MALKIAFQNRPHSKKAPKTCFNCRNLQPESYQSEDTYNARFDCEMSELHQAASNGCEICSFVQAAIGQIFDTEGQANIHNLSLVVATLPALSTKSLFQWFRNGENIDNSVFVNTKSSMEIQVGISDHPKYKNVVNGRTYDVILQDGGQQLPWVQLRTAKPTTFFGSTGSKLAAEWVQARLQECRTLHSECRAIDLSRSSMKPLLPKRIIEILDNRCVRLKESAEERADYACLSHCWGGAKSLITETTTLHRHLDEIVWHELPKTFQDAIVFLPYLNIRYIWIDSLCIIQDSEEDWLEHSGSMAEIYSNACITVAATRAANGSAGLFTNSHEIALSCGNAQLLICEQPKHAHPGNVTDETFPLLTRGWVAQEMLLSPKIVHFCNGELMYECMRGAICSCCTTRDLSHTDYGRKSPIWNMDTKKVSGLPKLWSFLGNNNVAKDNSSQNQCPPEKEYFTEWRQMLMRYSNLGLTFEKDRLPAVSGLARRFSNKFKATYAAGLWVENLRNDLLWVMPHRLKPERRRLEAGAPTWSWASCGSNTSSYMCFPGSHLYFTIVAVECVPLSECDPFGQLKSATLTLQGPLMPLILKRSKKGYDTQFDEHWGIEVEPDLTLDSILTDANEKGLFFGLPIVRQQMETRGLVLHLLGDGHYERVGLWSCSSKEGYYQRFDPLDWWRAETLHEVLETIKLETILMV